MAKRDYYEVLGIQKGADEKEIKRAYKRLAMKYHPDRTKGDKESEEKFKEINEAYEVLADKEKRATYDQFGHAAFENGGAGAGGFGGFSGADFGDIFGDMFGDIFGGGRGRQRVVRGEDLRYDIEITLEEAVRGTKKDIQINTLAQCEHCHGSGAKPGTQPESCPRCKGKGQLVMTQQSFFGSVQQVVTCPECHGSGKIIKEKCPDCRGEGYITKEKELSVKIPAGIDDGQTLRLSGSGDPGLNGGPRGDLLVNIAVGQHPFFKRQGTNIYSTEAISFAKAALGGKTIVKTVDGPGELSIKAGTQTDTRVRLRGKGVPHLQSPGVRGDQYVTLVVSVPTKLNKKQQEALKAYAEAVGETA